MGGERRPLRGAAWTLAVTLAALSAAGLLVLLISGASLRAWHAAAGPLLAAAVVGAVVALLGMRQERQVAREATGEEGGGGTVEDVEAELEDAREKLKREREAGARGESARRVEREWNRELREQVVRAHRERGELGDADDIEALVLHIATTLLDAEKGALFRRTEGGEGLELSCAEGFESDPRDSHLAHRFAREVVQRDTTIREDGYAIEGEDPTPADGEIDNLVAIPIYVQDEFSGVIVCANKQGGFQEHDDEVLLSLGDHAGAVLENQRLRGGLRGAYLDTVRVLADAI